MSQTTATEVATPPAHKPETTFKNYTSNDAERYAAYRPVYDPRLIELVLKTHTSTGGETLRLLDVGCGPALATRQVAPYFQHVAGTDASPSMIAKAQQTPCPSATGEQSQFSVCNSEEIDKMFEPESIDLITVATAAHWFDMPKFYAAAAKVLKPSGSIAMWCGGSWYADPKTTPNVERIQEVWTQLEHEILRPFEMPAHRHCRELYEFLPMPWTIDTNSVAPEIAEALKMFDKQRSMRKEFNKDGQPQDDEMLRETKGYMTHSRVTLEQAAMMFSTASQVTRWRQAHKEQVEKGEIEDCVDKMMRLTKEELEKGEGKGRDWIEAVAAFVVIVIKKKAE